MLRQVMLTLATVVAFAWASRAAEGRSHFLGDQHPANGLEPLHEAPHDTSDTEYYYKPPNIQPPAKVVHSKMRDSIKESVQGDTSHNPQIPSTHLSRDTKVIKKWFSWHFWQLIVLCTLTLFIFSEAVYPLVHFFKRSLVIDSAIFFLQMLSFMIVAALFAKKDSAGAAHASALATIMMAISFLIFLMACMMVWGEKDKSALKVDNDIGGLFCPFSRLIAVFLIIQGVLDESDNDFGSLTLLVSFTALGVAFAIGDIVKDVVSYIFIRNKHVFCEEDFVEYNGEMYQIRKISWRNTTAYRMKTRSMALIPNHKLALSGLNNQSKDDARVVEFDFPLPGQLPGENLQTIVRESWALLRGLEETGFKAFNGELYECQIDVPKTAMYLGNINAGSGDGKEFPYIDLHMRLFGKYYYSKAPPWKQEDPEPPPEERQLDWLMKWKYQVEWFIVEIKKIVDRHSV